MTQTIQYHWSVPMVDRFDLVKDSLSRRIKNDTLKTINIWDMLCFSILKKSFGDIFW